MESRKKVLMNLFAGKEWKCRMDCDTVGEGESGTNGESSVDVCTLQYVR